MATSYLRQDIQGLRGISILAVVLYHAFPQIVPGGYVGVDIFFVISGYVITCSILRDCESGRFSVANFYRRRVRRIFPALYFLLIFVLLLSCIILPPTQLYEVAQSSLATIFFSSNFFFWKTTGYFEGPAALKPLLHTWSLSVEEQFYVIYPMLFAFLYSRSAKLLKHVLFILLLFSLLLSCWMVSTHIGAAFFFSPPRAFELLLGAIVALPGAGIKVPQRLRDMLSLLGLLAILVAPFVYHDSTPFPGVAALLPCLGAMAIIYCGNGKDAYSLAGRWVSLRLLTFFGVVSYSLYLWHWPMLVAARWLCAGQMMPPIALLFLVLALIASYISRLWVEQPFLQAERSKMPYLKMGACAMSLTALGSLSILAAHALPQRFSASSQRLFAAEHDFNPKRESCNFNDGKNPDYSASCIFGAPQVQPDTAVWGDSHGAELAVVLGERLAPQHRAVIEITGSACPPARHLLSPATRKCPVFVETMLRGLIHDSNIHNVILCANFARYQGPLMPALYSGYTEVAQQLRASGKRVILVYPIPVYPFDPPAILGLRNQLGLSNVEIGMAHHDYLQANAANIAFLDQLAIKNSFSRVFPEEIYCPAQNCVVYDPSTNGVLYFNPDHLSLVGARKLAAAISL